MKVLVTGATGFVGRAIVKELLEDGMDVIAAGGPRSAKSERFFSIDVSDKNSFLGLRNLGSVDAIIHAAGLAHRFGHVAEDEYKKVNVNGVKNIANLAASLKARHFLLISSVLVYGSRQSEYDQIISEECVCKPNDAYAQSKLDGEVEAENACKENGINLTILRPAPIIGEGSKGNFSRLIKAIDKRRFIWVGSGTNMKSLVYVDDVAIAVRMLLRKKNKATEIFNVSGKPAAMNEIVNAISESLSKSVSSLRIPPKILLKSLQTIKKIGIRSSSDKILRTLDTWLSQDIYSSEKIAQSYGFEAPTKTLEAIRKEALWYKAGK